MLRTMSAIAASAALAAFAFIALPALVNASSPVPAEKGDLADSGDCELQGWPYYARGCLRDDSRNAGRAVKVRLVTTDRVTVPLPIDRDAPPAEHAATQPQDDAPEAPAGWMMSDHEVRTIIAAGDFIRRTVR